MSIIKSSIRRIVRQLGYDIIYFDDRRLIEPDWDLLDLLKDVSRPVILDVGANIGQSVIKYKRLFPDSIIHSFEPGPEAFQALKEISAAYNDIHLNNIGVGNAAGDAVLLENSESYLSSLLPLGATGFGSATKETPISITTLDCYCETQSVEHVDLLKTDTQGFDLSVLKGASRLLESNKVRLVLTEITFTNLYQTADPFYSQFDYLIERGFQFAAFYRLARHLGLAGWCDALFINPNFSQS